jgi:hypothetical protein
MGMANLVLKSEEVAGLDERADPYAGVLGDRPL